MKIYRISSYIVEIDPLIQKASEDVVDRKKQMREVIDNYGFNSQDKIDELSEAVIELRKMRSLPVDAFKNAYEKSRETSWRGAISTKKIAELTGLSIDDIVWLIRRLFPKTRIQPTKKELEEIVQMRKDGFSLSEIQKKTRLEYQSLTVWLEKLAPDLLREHKPKSFWENLYVEYQDMTKRMSRDEALDKLCEIHDIKDRAYLKRRFWKLGDPTEREYVKNPISEEEAQDIINEFRNGKTFREIADLKNRNPATISNLIKEKAPDLYNAIPKRAPDTPKHILQFIRDQLIMGLKNKEIARLIKEKYDYDVKTLTIAVMKNRMKNQGLLPTTEENANFDVNEINANMPSSKVETEQPLPEESEALENPQTHLQPSAEKIESLKEQLNKLIESENMVRENVPGYVSKRREELENYLKLIGVMAKNNKLVKTAKKAEHHYSWVYINLPKDIQEKLIEFGEEIDLDDLYVKEAEDGLELDPHATVKYGLLTEDVKDIKRCLDGLKGGKVYMGKSSIFTGDKYDVVKITVESEALENLHNNLNKLPHEDKHMEYQPHATIAYVKSGRGEKYDGKFNIGETFKFAEAFFGNNKRDFKIKLASNKLTINNLNWYRKS